MFQKLKITKRKTAKEIQNLNETSTHDILFITKKKEKKQTV